MIRTLTAIFFCFYLSSSLAQVGFLKALALGSDEPNASLNVIQLDDNIVAGGYYFDQSIGRWTMNFLHYDKEGSYYGNHTLKTDTVTGSHINSTIESDSIGLYVMNIGYGGRTHVICYDTSVDTVGSFLSYNYFDEAFSASDFKKGDGTNEFVFCGRDIQGAGTDRDVMMLLVSPDTVIRTTIVDSENDCSARLLGRNSSNHWVVACNSTLYAETGDFNDDFTFIMFFDEDLQLISDAYTAGKESHHMRMSTGMLVDQNDNVLVVGTQFETVPNVVGYGFPSVTKFDPLGNHLWTRRLGNSLYNKSAEGRWHSIIESKEKDGYILVGSEAREPRWSYDSLVVKAAIAKISYEGDSIWYRTYSYREGLHRVDKLYDVILSTDGNYIAAGRSRTFSNEESELPWIQSLLLKTDSKGIYLKEGVSSIEIDTDLDINVYPNPVTGPLYITQESDIILQVKLVSSAGIEIDAFTIDGSTHTHVLDTSHYEEGLYYLLVSNAEGAQQSIGISVVKY